MLLTADDLAELTGYRSAQGQRRWLDARGWRYEVARDNRNHKSGCNQALARVCGGFLLT